MGEALFVFGIDNAGTPEGPAACEGNRVSEQNKGINQASRHTCAALRKAVAQAITPATLAVHSYLTIQGVPVATRCHGSCSLQFFDREAVNTLN
jgi:hypothetical protein